MWTPARIDAGSAVAAALGNLKSAIDESAAAVIVDAGLPAVHADRTQLIQLFQNLIGNAIKYRSKDRPAKVHVGTSRDSNAWLFWVRDNGIGIKAEDQDRVFVIFQRLHTREQYSGTGVGLAICRKIVERLGGRIWVESQPGQGSTFLFRIPDTPAPA